MKGCVLCLRAHRFPKSCKAPDSPHAVKIPSAHLCTPRGFFMLCLNIFSYAQNVLSVAVFISDLVHGLFHHEYAKSADFALAG